MLDGPNSICISGIEVESPDGSKALVTGDVPVLFCGWPGYYDTITTITGDEGVQHTPKCFWMDENGKSSVGLSQEE